MDGTVRYSTPKYYSASQHSTFEYSTVSCNGNIEMKSDEDVKWIVTN